MVKVSFDTLQSRFNDILSRIQIVEDESVESAPVCETCGGGGYIRYTVPLEHPMFGRLVLCPSNKCAAANAIRARRYEKTMKSSGLPASYAALSFDSWYALPKAMQRGKQLAAAAAWVFCQHDNHAVTLQDAAAAAGHNADALHSRPKNWLVFQGGLGLGKTGIAAAVVNELAVMGKPVLYMRLQDMFSEIQSRYTADEPPTADDVVKSIKTAPVLVLDEFNIPNVSADKSRLVEEIIRYRHGQRLATIITCNVTPQEFESMWGGRTADVTMESAHWIELSGAKIRKTDSAIRSF